MKLLEKDHYTDDATRLNRELVDALQRVTQSYLAKGASIREVALLAHHAVTNFECATIIGSRVQKKTIQEMAQSLTEN